MTDEQRSYVLKRRKEQSRPYHSLPHTITEREYFHLSAACYEHKSIIGQSISRITKFEDSILNVVNDIAEKLCSYALLPNHYHLLVKANDIKKLLNEMFKLHRRTALEWNKEDILKGRRVWCNIMDSGIKGEKHFWAVMNYIHNNPVKHGYVKKWGDWCYSSANFFIENEGMEKTLFIWEKYDISYMCKWDV